MRAERPGRRLAEQATRVEIRALPDPASEPHRTVEVPQRFFPGLTLRERGGGLRRAMGRVLGPVRPREALWVRAASSRFASWLPTSGCAPGCAVRLRPSRVGRSVHTPPEARSVLSSLPPARAGVATGLAGCAGRGGARIQCRSPSAVLHAHAESPAECAHAAPHPRRARRRTSSTSPSPGSSTTSASGSAVITT